jgi:hypothetical protein
MEALSLLVQLSARVGVVGIQRILGLERQHTEQLRRIETKIDASLAGPYNSAIEHLKIAGSPGTTPQSRNNNLRWAEEQFIAARGNLTKVDPLQSAWAAVYLVVICKLTDRPREAADWASRAHADAVRAVELRCQEINDRIDSRVGKKIKLTTEKSMDKYYGGGVVAGALIVGSSLIAGPAVAVVGAATAGGIHVYRGYRAKKGRSALNELHDFVTQVAQVRSALGDAIVPMYSIVSTPVTAMRTS